MKKVVEELKKNGADEQTIKDFQTKTQTYYTKVIAPNFKDYDFYVGESMNTDGMSVYQDIVMVKLTNKIRVVLLNYREDGITPYITVWKYGLTETKV